MKKITILFAFAFGCVHNEPPPSCASVGCPSGEPLACRGLDGPCECPQGDGSKVWCSPTPTLGRAVIAICGTSPAAPGVSVAYNGSSATMPADQMQALLAWRDAVDAWTNCVAGAE